MRQEAHHSIVIIMSFSHMIWNNLEIKEVLSSLKTAPHGLSQEEAQRRLAEHGPNELQEKKRASPWMLFLEQFKDFLILILLIAAIISGALAAWGEGDVWDPILIVIIILFATILGFVQEYRSEKALDALKKMTAPTATAIRSGEEKEIPGSEDSAWRHNFAANRQQCAC